MARPPRIDFPGARHHVMNRGARRKAFFEDDETCALFADLVGETSERFGVAVHAYALMPNHFHLQVESVRGNLSDAMKSLQGRFTQALNGRKGWDGPVFRGRFKSRLVQDDAYWMHLLAYLHLNPVEAHLVPTLDQSRWTSHGAYAGHDPAPAWLTTRPLLDLFGGRERYLEYAHHVQIGRERGPRGFDEGALWSGPRRPVPADARPPAPTSTADQALAQVARVVGVRPDALRRSPRGRRGHPARWLAAWWLAQTTGLKQIQIAAALGTRPETVSRLIGRATRRLATDDQLAAWRDELERLAAQKDQ